MRARRQGPVHAADHEQVWVLLEGELSARVGGAQLTVAAGDTITIPAERERRLLAVTDVRAIVSSRAAPHVWTPDAPARELPWAV